MARSTFIPPGPVPVPYRLGDPAGQTGPTRPESDSLLSMVAAEQPGHERRSLGMSGPMVPKRRDKAATRAKASGAVERAVSLAGRTVTYGRDTHDARLRERVAELCGMSAANALPYLHPGDSAAVAAFAVSGRINDTVRRALRRAMARASKA